MSKQPVKHTPSNQGNQGNAQAQGNKQTPIPGQDGKSIKQIAPNTVLYIQLTMAEINELMDNLIAANIGVKQFILLDERIKAAKASINPDT